MGHAHPAVVDAVREAARDGTSFGAPTSAEVDLAQMIVEAVPSIEMARLVNSGTEAVMSAVRLARGFTNRAKIIKFEGCCHGHWDALLARAGSGLATFGLPDSAGVPQASRRTPSSCHTTTSTRSPEAMRSVGGEVAFVLVEPVAADMGVAPPKPGYLSGLRELTGRAGALLVFDEVITGFRVSYGGAQELYRVTPDLTILGKIIGGGLPVEPRRHAR